MTDTKERIAKVEVILKKYDAPVLKYFNPGLAREAIIEFFNENKISLNPALIALYEWHNGVQDSNVMQALLEIMPMGMFYSLDIMIKDRAMINGWNFMEIKGDFLPLLGSGEDDIYLLNNSSGEIFYVCPAANIYGELKFKSIDSMLDFIIDCYEEEIFKIDPINGLEVNEDEYHKRIELYR